MNLLDLALVAAAVSAVWGGYRAGFLTRLASWVGLIVGAFAATLVLPSVLSSIELPSPTSRLLLAATVLVFGAFLGQAVGLILGQRVRRVLPAGAARVADRAVGAAAGGLGVLITAWLLLPSLADVPGWPARQARHSALAHFVDTTFPKPPDTVQALRRLVDERGFPRVFETLQPAPDVGVPPGDHGLSPEVVERVTRSTVKVMGEACRRVQEGSGFVAQQDVVVTNAHVVAGEERIEVLRPDGRRMVAAVAVFDPNRDLAVLHVPGLGQPALTRGAASTGTTGAVFGHPLGQEQVRPAPAGISEQARAVGRDIYNGHQTERSVFILASRLQSGDSGAALVDGDGRVVGVAFAVAPDRPGTAYALTVVELDGVLARYSANPANRESTRECLVS